MTRKGLSTRIAIIAGVAAMALTAPAASVAQERPADLTTLPPVPTDYQPERTPWGDPDFTGTFPIEFINNARILFQRPDEYGDRYWVNDEEFERRLEAARRQDGSFAAASDRGIGTSGTQGLVAWMENTDFAKQTSMLVSPADGKLPPLTPEAQALFEAGRSGWVPGQSYDWVDDFDSWDRCVTRGYPASMYPFRYNNGIRIFQSPGVVTIILEMLGTRVVKLYDSKEAAQAAQWPDAVEGYFGNSRGWWEGNTLVIETTNILHGDSATSDPARRAASPLNMATQWTGTEETPSFNTIPVGPHAMTVERLTMTDENTIVHELTYSDPDVYTQPWSTRLAWVRDEDYEFFEYACHEGNVQLRNYITASRAQRRDVAAGLAEPVTAENDDRSRFASRFDYDPGTGPRPGFGPPPPPAPEEEGDEG